MAQETTPFSVLVIHGPNLNMLGKREPEVYGKETLAAIDTTLRELGHQRGLAVETFQSNHEGAIVDRIQAALGKNHALIINPGAYTHTSVAIRDALLLLDIPIVEIHLSNIYKREPFRHHSFVAGVATGQISGFGAHGYSLALEAVSLLLHMGKKK
ncbi:MAG: type II 3-dehydroquinate dehydratase [Pseudomonadota bacterium]